MLLILFHAIACSVQHSTILAKREIFTTYQFQVYVSLTKHRCKAEILQYTVGLMQYTFKVTVDLRGVFWGKQYTALCIN